MFPGPVALSMVQPRLTSLLSPVSGSTRPCSQSLPCGQGSPAPTPASSSDRQRVSDSPVQPKRKTVKSKRAILAEKKAQRKRDKLNKRTNSRPLLPKTVTVMRQSALLYMEPMTVPQCPPLMTYHF